MNPTVRLALGVTFVIGLLGCASQPSQSVIIDRRGVDMQRYAIDLEECAAYAREVPVEQNTARDAARGAAVGGAVGAIVGGTDAAVRTAGVGAVGGATRGLIRSEAEQRVVVRNCLRGRGYRVLN